MKTLMRVWRFISRLKQKARGSKQTYDDDLRFRYHLVAITPQGTYSRTFGTSVPLVVGHHVVLGGSSQLRVNHVSHVVYHPSDTPTLTRPTTFCHVGVSFVTIEADEIATLLKLGFELTRKKFYVTLH